MLQCATMNRIKRVPVAQLDRVTDSDSVGHGFESHRVRQTNLFCTAKEVYLILFLCVPNRSSKKQDLFLIKAGSENPNDEDMLRQESMKAERIINDGGSLMKNNTEINSCKTVLVTGASGGSGGALARLLLERGYRVFGCDLRAASIEHPEFHALNVDVTSEQSVQKAFNIVAGETDALRAIVNTSGIMFMGSLIEEPPGRLEQIVSVNLLGTDRINRVFFPLIENGRGRIINFSSEYGKYTTIPFNAFYTISKHAVESYADGLRRELQYLGIPVITVRPGAFKTDMEKSTEEIFFRIKNNSTHYEKILERMEPLMNIGKRNAKQPEIMAEAVLKAIEAKKPKRVYSCNHNFLVTLLSTLPERLTDRIFYFLFRN